MHSTVVTSSGPLFNLATTSVDLLESNTLYEVVYVDFNNHKYLGSYVYKPSGVLNLVCITKFYTVWGFHNIPPFQLIKLPKGTRVILEQE